MDSWRYYNHSAIPNTAPHIIPNLEVIKSGKIWDIPGFPLLARWTTDFDTNRETQWWYVIKDTPFDINALKAKRRYEINKGLGNFDVKRIVPMEHIESIYNVTVQAYSAWPKKYRPTVNHDSFVTNIETWQDLVVYGAFSKIDGTLSGYAYLKVQGQCLDFSVLRTVPSCERLGVNAAIVATILNNEKSFLENGNYICDGARSMRHETAFQDYLEKYFGFRKAYCTLNIKYRRGFGVIVKILYPFRKILKKLTSIGLVSSIVAILSMEEIIRTDMRTEIK